MRMLTWFAVVACLFACEKKSGERVRFDPDLLLSAQARYNNVLGDPSVNKAFDTYLDGLFADPALAPVGEQLTTSLASDPNVMGPLRELLEDMEKSEVMKTLVVDLMTANPHATPDQIGELVGQHIEKVFASPHMNASLQTISVELMHRLDTRDAFKPLSNRFDRTITEGYEQKWSNRLIELNGGSVPSPHVATQLILDHALDEKRLEKFLITVLTNNTMRGQSAKLVARTLSVPAVAQELRSVVADLVQDPAIQKHMRALFDLMLATQPDETAIEATLRELLLSERTVADVGRFVRTVFADPSVAKLMGEFVDGVAADTKLRAAFDDLMNGW
jgi:hypothetical protein